MRHQLRNEGRAGDALAVFGAPSPRSQGLRRSYIEDTESITRPVSSCRPYIVLLHSRVQIVLLPQARLGCPVHNSGWHLHDGDNTAVDASGRPLPRLKGWTK